MSDKLARAVGSGAILNVNGKDYTIRPVSLQQLQEIQREALRFYKRQFLSTYADNADLLGDRATKLIEEKIEEASRWDVQDLPSKHVYDVSRIPVSPELETWLVERFGELPDSLTGKQALVAASLDAEDLTQDQIHQMTGRRAPKVKAPYDAWWVTASYEGMVTLVWAGLGGAATREEVRQWPLSKIVEASRAVERMTAPDLGNT